MEKLRNLSIENIIDRLAKGEIWKNHYYDLMTEQVIIRLKDRRGFFIDVGCFAGSILDVMIDNVNHGKMLAFEPLPVLFDKLSIKYEGNERVKLFNYALSDKKGESTFNYVISNPGYSGLIKRDYDRPIEEDMNISVHTLTLDSLLEGEDSDEVSFIKIDVEGAEYLVLTGAINTIKRCKPVIVFEHGLGASDCYGYGPKEIYDLVCDECGMKISLMENWLMDGNTLSYEEFYNEYYGRKNYYFIAHE